VELERQSAWWERASRALRHSNYRRYFLAQIPLLIGSWIHSIALGWLMWRLSASPWMLGVLAMYDLGPTFVLSPVAGTIIDRMNPHKLLIVLQASCVVLVAILVVTTLTNSITVELLVAVTLGLGVLAALENPARQVFVAELVGPDDLRNAIALNSMLFNLARLIGPAIGGTVIAVFGEGWCFVLKALTYFPMLFTLVRMQTPPRHVGGRQSFITEMMQSFAFVRTHKEAGRLLLLVGTCSLASVPYFYFLPALVREMLQQNADAAGWLMSMTGLGAILAALTLTVRDRLEQLNIWPAWSSVMLGATLTSMGLSTTYWITALLALALGFAILSQNLSSNTLLQHFAPPGLRGRVMAMYSMMLLGTVPLGSAIVGAIGARFGMPVTFIAGGLLCSILGTMLALGRPGAPVL
jgi:MFS family permease